jgi:hypothetical protein
VRGPKVRQKYVSPPHYFAVRRPEYMTEMPERFGDDLHQDFLSLQALVRIVFVLSHAGVEAASHI